MCPSEKAKPSYARGGKRTEASPRRAGCTLNKESKPKPRRRTWGNDPVRGLGLSVQYEEANRNKKVGDLKHAADGLWLRVPGNNQVTRVGALKKATGGLWVCVDIKTIPKSDQSGQHKI